MVWEVSGLVREVLKARYVLSIATQLPTHRAKPRNSITINLAIAFVKASNLSRAKGGDVSAHLAYRAGLKLIGTNDFSKRKQTIQEAYFVGWSGTHDEFAKAVNTAERRKDSRLIKELIWALPHDSTDELRSEIVRTYAESLRDRFGVAVHVAIHKPKPKDTAILPSSGLNWHAHISITRRAVDDGGNFGAKALPQIDKEAWLDAEKDRLVDLVNSVVLEPASREPIYGAPVPTVGRAWQAERQAEASGQPITTQPGERFRAFSWANNQTNLQAAKDAIETLDKEIEYERTLTAAELRREAAATAAAERARAMAERNRSAIERLRILTLSVAQGLGKIFRIGPVEIRRLDGEIRRLDGADERLGHANRRIGGAISDYAGVQLSMRRYLQQDDGGLHVAGKSLSGDEGGIPRISLPSFDVTALSDLIADKKEQMRRREIRRKAPTPFEDKSVKFISDYIANPTAEREAAKEIAPEEYDPKKHGALLSSLDQKPKPKGHGPSMG